MSVFKKKLTLLLAVLSLFFYVCAPHCLAQQSVNAKQEEWVSSTAYGFPITIALNDVVNANGWRRRELFILIESQHFTEENIKKLFKTLPADFRQPETLWITAFSDRAMLQRAINNHKSGIVICWTNTPEGLAAAAKWAEKYEPLPSGYYRARYNRTVRDNYGQKYYDEDYSYSPDPMEVGEVKVILQGKPAPPYSGNLNSDLLRRHRFDGGCFRQSKT